MSSKRTPSSVSRGLGQLRSRSTPKMDRERQGERSDERVRLLSPRSPLSPKEIQKKYLHPQRGNSIKVEKTTKTASPKLQHKKQNNKASTPTTSKSKKEKNSTKKNRRPSLSESLERVTRNSSNNQGDGPPPLPQRGWCSAIDPNAKVKYYYHSVTCETQWTKPADYDKETMAYFAALKEYKLYHRKQLISHYANMENNLTITPSGTSTHKVKASSKSPFKKKGQRSKKVEASKATAADKYIAPSDRYIPVLPQERDINENSRQVDWCDVGTRASNHTNTSEKISGSSGRRFSHGSVNGYHPALSPQQDSKHYDEEGNVRMRYDVGAGADDDDDSVVTGTRTSAYTSVYPDTDDFLPLDIVDDPTVVDDYYFDESIDNSIMDSQSFASSMTPLSQVRTSFQSQCGIGDDFGPRAVAGCQAPFSTERWRAKMIKNPSSSSHHYSTPPPRHIHNRHNYRKQQDRQRSHSEPRVRFNGMVEI